MPVHDRIDNITNHISRLMSVSDEYHLFLSCSSSSDSIKSVISKLSSNNITIRYVPSTYYWSESINYLIQLALYNSYRFFCTLNDDVEVSYSSLRVAFDLIIEDPLQLLSMHQYTPSSTIPFLATCYRGKSLKPCTLVYQLLPTKPLELPIPSTTNGCCLLFSEAVTDQIGTFDSSAAPHYYSDTIFQLFAQQLGIKHILVPVPLFQCLDKSYLERLGKRNIFSKASYLYPPAFFKFTLLLSSFSQSPLHTFAYWYLQYIKQIFRHILKQVSGNIQSFL